MFIDRLRGKKEERPKNQTPQVVLRPCAVCVRRMDTYDGENMRIGAIATDIKEEIPVRGFESRGRCNARAANGARGADGYCYIQNPQSKEINK